MTDAELEAFILATLKDSDAQWQKRFGAAQISPTRLANLAQGLRHAIRTRPEVTR